MGQRTFERARETALLCRVENFYVAGVVGLISLDFRNLVMFSRVVID